jgi:NADPH2:quinone reductase
MGNYIVEPEESGPYFRELFDLVGGSSPKLKINIHKEYPFTAASVIQSQKDLTSGLTVGKLLVKL